MVKYTHDIDLWLAHGIGIGISIYHFVEQRLHGIGPDFVACGGEVAEIRHDFGGDAAVGLEEVRADVEVADSLAVVQGDRRRINGSDAGAKRVVRELPGG